MEGAKNSLMSGGKNRWSPLDKTDKSLLGKAKRALKKFAVSRGESKIKSLKSKDTSMMNREERRENRDQTKELTRRVRNLKREIRRS